MNTKEKALPGRCCGSASPSWQVMKQDGDYPIPKGTILTMVQTKPAPDEEYQMQFQGSGDGNPGSQLQSISLIPVIRKPPSEIAFNDLQTMTSHWNDDYLQSAHDILSSQYNYMMGFGRINHVPTLAVFIQSKYSGQPGDCRICALVLKKLDEVGSIRSRLLQGGVIHGNEN
jgi:hypothetical protein